MSLKIDMTVEVGATTVSVDIDAPAGQVTALLGPNGAGKTTVLRCVAGNVAIDDGVIALGDTILDRPPDTFVAPPRRGVGIVYQDHLLLPHLDALDNVAFGPRCHGRSRSEARAIAAQSLERLGVGALARARPGTLSGGEQQRVAIARALASDPNVLLLDEPLGALDAGTRTEVRRDLGAFLASFAGPAIHVTHDPIDALALADRVVILEHGTVTQTGTVAEITSHPASRYVADLIGTNLLRGRGHGTTITTSSGATLTAADPLDGPVLVTIAPNAIALHRSEPEGSSRNRWPTTVLHIDGFGDRTRVQLGPPIALVAEITAAAARDLNLFVGDAVWISVKATEIAAYAD